MKIDRLIGILAVLLQRDIVTTLELSERFEVSRRTINRDIETLCQSGIPVSTLQGVGGGIRIMENYKIDSTLLTSRDMQEILAGLRSLDSVSGSRYYGQLMERLQPGSSSLISGGESVLIDLSSWNKASLSVKIKEIRTAIEERRLLSFCYYNEKGEEKRLVEPYYLVFQWSSWYVWGFCRKRADFRLFKLNRMEQLKVHEERFPAREVPLPDLTVEHVFTGGIHVKALFAPEMKWKLIEEFGADSFTKQPDGRLLFRAEYTNRENLVSWLLAFGSKAELIEPKDIRSELLKNAEQMIANYKEEDKK